MEPRRPGFRSQTFLLSALMDVCSTCTHTHVQTHMHTPAHIDTCSLRLLYASVQKLYSDHCSIF